MARPSPLAPPVTIATRPERMPSLIELRGHETLFQGGSIKLYTQSRPVQRDSYLTVVEVEAIGGKSPETAERLGSPLNPHFQFDV